MQVSDKNRDNRSTLVLAVVCGVLQLAVAPNLGLGNGRANFALVFAACVALAVGGRRGVLAGFFAGLFFDLSTTGPIGLMAFCLSISSYVLGLGGRGAASDIRTGLSRFVVADLSVSLVYHLAMLVVGRTSSLVDAVALRALPTALVTLVAFVPFALFLSRVRGSGPSLGGSHRRRGGRFGTRGL